MIVSETTVQLDPISRRTGPQGDSPVRSETDVPAPSAFRKTWLLPSEPGPAAVSLANDLGLPPAFAAILWQSGFRTTEDARAYLFPKPADLVSPSLLQGMDRAVSRLLQAVSNREPVLIYGDYDVDGTLATVLLKTAIDRLTPPEHMPLVRYHIPHRIREGYGIQSAVLADAYASGVRLAISVDTGIRAFAAAEEAKRLGLDLIVTDHHLPDEAGVPDAIAVINPNQQRCSYPFKDLCGAAVAYKLAEALLRTASEAPMEGIRPVTPESLAKLLPSLLKLVAIATVADAVPLRGENRSIVSIGLRELRNPRQPGLRALMRLAEAGGEGVAPTAMEIGFRIGPRINAAGRMDIASDVVRLLLTPDAAEGEQLAQKLHKLNDDRRSVEQTVLRAIEKDFLDGFAQADHATLPDCLVIDGEGWHRGVIGILASRVVERSNLPALVITHEEGVAHGSGRSIAGFHLLDAITAAHASHKSDTGSALFDRFGGHAHAVGFSLPSAHVAHLRSYLRDYARANLQPQHLERTLHIASELRLDEISLAAIAHLRQMEPFGHGNPEPVFVIYAVRIAAIQPLKEQHVRLRLEDGDTSVNCLAWARAFSWPERLRELQLAVGSLVDVAFQLRENRHPDFGGAELQLCDIRAHRS